MSHTYRSSAITLEQFARDNGSRYPYHDAPCYGNFKNGTAASSKITQALETDSICEVRLLGKWFDTASFPLYVFSISVAVQAVMVCSLGDAADNRTCSLDPSAFFSVCTAS